MRESQPGGPWGTGRESQPLYQAMAKKHETRSGHLCEKVSQVTPWDAGRESQPLHCHCCCIKTHAHMLQHTTFPCHVGLKILKNNKTPRVNSRHSASFFSGACAMAAEAKQEMTQFLESVDPYEEAECETAALL